MFRENFKQILKDHKFVIGLCCCAALVASFCQCWSKIQIKDQKKLKISVKQKKKKPPAKLIKKQKRKGFSLSCFEGYVKVSCKPTEKGFNHCKESIKKIIELTCKKMNKIRISPLSKIKIKIKKFKIDKDGKCEEWAQRGTNCLPHFLKEKDEGEFKTSYVAIGENSFKNEKFLLSILAHEFTHAFLVSDLITFSRVVNEFFAIYISSKIAPTMYYQACKGSKSWDQGVFSTYKGEYKFPHNKENKLEVLINRCRYAQLEHLTRRLDKKYPKLYLQLWVIMDLVIVKKFHFTPLKLLSEIREIDKGAWMVASKYYAFQQMKSNSQIVVLTDEKEICFFPYRSINVNINTFCPRACIQIIWKRKGKFKGIFSGGNVNFFCMNKKNIKSKDVFYIKSRACGGGLFKKFVYP